MPISGDFGKLERLAQNMRDLAKKNGKAQKAVASATVPKIKQVWREQFKSGVGPDGPWARTKAGKQPLASRKIGSDFKGVPVAGGVLFKSPVKWLSAHHYGQTFPARSVAARQNILRFNKKGKLVTAKRFDKLKKGRAVFAAAHAVGSRRLPPRPLYPTNGRMPDRWAKAINDGAAEAMRRWAVGATKRLP